MGKKSPALMAEAKEPITEQALALRDEGWSWPDIGIQLGFGQQTLKAWCRERCPELAELSQKTLAKRHRERQEFWGQLLGRLPDDEEAAEAREALQEEMKELLTSYVRNDHREGIPERRVKVKRDKAQERARNRRARERRLAAQAAEADREAA